MSFSWYGFIVGCGLALFWWQWQWLLEKYAPKKITEGQLITGALLIFLGSLLGARLYHVVTDWMLYQGHWWPDVFLIWQGGLGIFGGIMGGIIGLVLWKRWLQIPLSLTFLFDTISISLPLTQAVGRWGNYVNQELFGPPLNAPWAIAIDIAHRPPQFLAHTHFHPLFLYESIATFLLWLFLRFLLWHNRSQDIPITKLGTGLYAGLYLISYGLVRFSIDIWRWDLLTPWGQLTVSQWISLLCLVLGLVFLRRIPYNWRET